MNSIEKSNAPTSVMRCLRCKSACQRSGREPHRVVCEGCGQNYLVVMQLVPVEADERTPMLEAVSAE